MATQYRATLNVGCMKQHVCLNCGAVFSYSLNRQVNAAAAEKASAATMAEAAALKALEEGIEHHLCPHCGFMQPDMVAAVRRERFLSGIWLALIMVVVALLLGWPQWVTYSTSAWIATGGVGLGFAFSMWGVRFNPNRGMMAGQRKSAERVRRRELSCDMPGDASSVREEFGQLTSEHFTGLSMIGVGLLAVAAPLCLPSLNSWSMNASYSAVIGPGDSATIYFDQELQSIKGMWQGTVSTSATVDDDRAQTLNVRAQTQNSYWGDTISGKGLANQSNKMFATVTIPEDATLAGKSINLTLEANVVFPLKDIHGFIEQRGTFLHQQTLKLSSIYSGRNYWRAWFFGQVLAIVLCLLGGMMLMKSAARLAERANPAVTLAADHESD